MRKEKICLNCDEEFQNRGKLCTSCYQKDYYERHKEQIRLKKQKYYLANKKNIDAKSRKYTEENKEKVKLRNRTHYHNNSVDILKYQRQIRNTPKRKFGQAVKSAKERELEWIISYDDYVQIIAKSCHYCDKSLERFGGSSLDRIDNSTGYTLDNVLPCCGTCNNIRNNFLTVEEMEVAMAAVVEYRKRSNNYVATRKNET